MQQIEVRIISGKKAVEIRSANAGREFSVEEIELGIGKYKKPVKYDKHLKPQTECKAVIITTGKIRIVQ